MNSFTLSVFAPLILIATTQALASQVGNPGRDGGVDRCAPVYSNPSKPTAKGSPRNDLRVPQDNIQRTAFVEVLDRLKRELTGREHPYSRAGFDLTEFNQLVEIFHGYTIEPSSTGTSLYGRVVEELYRDPLLEIRLNKVEQAELAQSRAGLLAEILRRSRQVVEQVRRGVRFDPDQLWAWVVTLEHANSLALRLQASDAQLVGETNSQSPQLQNEDQSRDQGYPNQGSTETGDPDQGSPDRNDPTQSSQSQQGGESNQNQNSADRADRQESLKQPALDFFEKQRKENGATEDGSQSGKEKQATVSDSEAQGEQDSSESRGSERREGDRAKDQVRQGSESSSNWSEILDLDGRSTGFSNGKNAVNRKLIEDKPFSYLIYRTLKQHFVETLLEKGPNNEAKNLAAQIQDLLNSNVSLKQFLPEFEKTVNEGIDLYRSLGDLRSSGDSFGKVFSAMANGLLSIRGKSLEQSWRRLIFLEKAMDYLAKERALHTAEQNFLSQIKLIKTKLFAIRHPGSEDYDLVHRLWEALPGHVSKSYLKSRFGDNLLELGSPAQNAFAQFLRSAKIAKTKEQLEASDLIKFALISEFAKLNLNSTRESNFTEMVLYQRSEKPQAKEDIVIAREPSEVFKKGILDPQGPGLIGLLQRFVRGEQAVLGSRQTVNIEDQNKQIERKISIVYYDISESMSGIKAEVQMLLLMAFVDIALSEQDAFGRPTHEIRLIEFGRSVGSEEIIKTREQALSYFKKALSLRATPAYGGTKIQKALTHFYTSIAQAIQDAKKSKGPKLDRANLVLISDGVSDVSKDYIEQLRANIDPHTRLWMSFLSIVEKNEVLRELAESSVSKKSKRLGDRGQFRFLSQEVIDKINIKASEFLNSANAFAVSENLELSRQDKESLSTIQQLLREMKPPAILFRFDQQHSDLIQTSIAEMRFDPNMRVEDREAVLGRLSDFKLITEKFLLTRGLDKTVQRRLAIAILAQYGRIMGYTRDSRRLGLNALSPYEYSLLNRMLAKMLSQD